MSRKLENILITGGSGFIGANFINYLFDQTQFAGKVVNVDKLTYAANPLNNNKVKELHNNKRYFFEKVDICDEKEIDRIFKEYNIDTVIHFAAESHVDRSIENPNEFIRTNVLGTLNLLNNALKYFGDDRTKLFHHISTDEVYGSLGETGLFYETTAYDPRSPYSASKASSDHLVSAYAHTYNLPVTISNCSNNYGPLQFPEKLIPLMISNILDKKSLPVYGEGQNIRDWLHVEDHCSAIYTILNKGECLETYNIGGESERRNIEIVNLLCNKVAEIKNTSPEENTKLIEYVTDRKGHDYRYAINCDKMKALGWTQKWTFEEGINHTINWYLSNQDWIDSIKSGNYRNL